MKVGLMLKSIPAAISKGANWNQSLVPVEMLFGVFNFNSDAEANHYGQGPLNREVQ